MGTNHTFLRVGAAATGALAMLALGTGSAQAVPPADGTSQVLAIVGSDTTFQFMQSYAAKYNNSSVNSDGDRLINVPAKLAPGQSVTVPAQGTCTTDRTYDANNLPPDGSGAGRKALYGTDGNPANADNPATACLDIARSSSPRGTSDPGTARFYAYAKDAVSYVYWGRGPANLSQQQLQDIYGCKVTNWSQVPGSNKTGTILRYLPQSGSGTRDFFLGTVLGGSPVAPSSPSCPLDESVQENTGTAVPKAKQNRAILPYSAGAWVAQNKAGAPDKSAGSKIGAINGVKAATGNDQTARINRTAVLDGSFIGSRFLYNVLDTRLPSYGQALRAVGVDNTGASPLCNGSSAPLITNAGFVPLTKGVTGGDITRQSFCRLS